MVSLSFLSSSTKRPLWQGQLLVVLCVVGFSLLGIGTRTSEYLASFWGTNAVMLGLLLRNPHWGARLAHLGVCLCRLCTDRLADGHGPIRGLWHGSGE